MSALLAPSIDTFTPPDPTPPWASLTQSHRTVHWDSIVLRPITSSQAVARIADRTATQQTLVISGDDYEINWNCRATWPKPRQLLGKVQPLFMRLLGIPHTKPCIKFEVCSLSSFEDMFDRMPKIVGVTWPRPRPLWGKIICAPAGHPHTKLRTKFEVSSSNSFREIAL